ncbi:MAG: tetratricopeptide repeat protein [Deltaproteobacteria bacterium]|nr:tetratricopeptide repeat protein [Deltaproteobacteria bacterium]
MIQERCQLSNSAWICALPHALCGLLGILIFLMFISAGPLLAKDAEVSSEKGIDRYKKLVKLNPHKATNWNALGYYYLKSGNLQEAELHFLRAIEIENSYPTPHNNLGVVYLKQDRPELAEKEFLQAVRLNPQYTKAQYNLAVALFHQKRYVDAAKAYFKARDLDQEYVNRRDNSENTQKKLQSALEQAAEDEESSKELKRMQKWLAPNN